MESFNLSKSLGYKTGAIMVSGSNHILIPFTRKPTSAIVSFDDDIVPNTCDPIPMDEVTCEIIATKPPHTHRWAIRLTWKISSGLNRVVRWEATASLRFMGVKNENIIWVSDFNPDLNHPVVVPERLDDVSDSDLIKHYVLRKGVVVKKKSNPRRIAVVSDYGVNCGIATYTEYLVNAMKLLTDEVVVFAEYLPKEQLSSTIDNIDIIRCWNRTNDDFSTLVSAIQKYDPDIIFIQHEFGLFHKMNTWSTLLSRLSRWRTIVTFHTVLDHKVSDQKISLDYRSRFAAESSCKEIIVHTPKAREVLRQRGFSGRVHYIPHGCFAPDRSPKLPVTKYGMFPEHSIFQYGFGGKYKGWDFAIDTIELLVKKYPHVIYVGVMNIPMFNDNDSYFRHLLDVVEKKELTSNVALHHGYQSDEVLKNFLRSCKLAMFPYQIPHKDWASWGASGAIQLPISLGVPMILSNYPAFQEFKGRIPLVTSPQEAADQIDKIFSDPSYCVTLSESAFAIADERQWDKVAQWYLSTSPNIDFNAPIAIP